MSFTLTAPSGIAQFQARSGNQYTVSAGTITVPLSDLADALNAGFTQPGSGGGSGNTGLTVTSQTTGNITLNSAYDNFYIAVTSGAAPGTITAPANPVLNKAYKIFDAGTGFASYPQTLIPNSGQGSFVGNTTLNTNNMVIAITYDGSNWRIS